MRHKKHIDHPRSMCWQKSAKNPHLLMWQNREHAGHIPERQACAEMQRRRKACPGPLLPDLPTPLPAGRELQTTHMRWGRVRTGQSRGNAKSKIKHVVQKDLFQNVISGFL